MDLKQIKLIKPREVADLLKLNLLTIYEYIRQGKLRAVKFGRNYRIHEEDLEEFIRSHTLKK
jgi:putative molybdopterin biosynthesis protein